MVPVGLAAVGALLIFQSISFLRNQEHETDRAVQQTQFLWSNYEKDRLAGNYTRISERLLKLLSAEQVALYDSNCDLIAAAPADHLLELVSCAQAKQHFKRPLDVRVSPGPNDRTARIIVERKSPWGPLLQEALLNSGVLFVILTVALFLTLRYIVFGRLDALLRRVIQAVRSGTPSQYEELVPVQNLIAEYQDEIQTLTLEAQKARIAAQVAHDVRSPLAALEMLVTRVSTIPEKQRTVIGTSIDRVREIINDLAPPHGRSTRTRLEEAAIPTTPLSLASLTDTLLAEKQAQYSDSNIKLHANFGKTAPLCVARVEAEPYKRVLSNLLNNAFEACGTNGEVTLSLSREANTVKIEVADTGRGIPADLVKKIGQAPISHDKPGGSGLGLFHACATIRSWGGVIRFLPRNPRGTLVQVLLPAIDLAQPVYHDTSV